MYPSLFLRKNKILSQDIDTNKDTVSLLEKVSEQAAKINFKLLIFEDGEKEKNEKKNQKKRKVALIKKG